MTLRLIALLLGLLSIVSPLSQARAALSQDDSEHAQSAFLFAGRGDWDNALQHAKETSDPVLLKLMTWQYLLDGDANAPFDEYVRFIEANPHWPEQRKLRMRAELSLRYSHVLDHDIIAWFGDDVPVTGIGKVELAEALARNKLSTDEKINGLIRSAWRDGDFEEPEEVGLLENYGDILTPEDHIARIDRLLWEEKTAAAKRMLDHVAADYEKLFKARIALQESKKAVSSFVEQVPSSLKNNPGLLYDRMIYRAHHDDDDGVRDILLAAPVTVPYPEKWWKQREYQVRAAIGEKQYALAGKLLATHGQIEGIHAADALWLQGWLDTEFLDRPKEGYDAFYSMFGKVRYPVSKARAAYWAARAAEKAGDADAASSWYATASSYPTTFYGELASFKINGTAPLHIPAAPDIDNGEQHDFSNNEIVHAIKLCIGLDQMDLANHLVALVIENTDDMAYATLIADLGQQTGHQNLGVRAAKKALQQNMVLIDAGYPVMKTPEDSPVESALMLAITRQESEFDPRAKSPSHALGMMQLLPKTAKEIARKNGLGFSPGRLLDAEYNMQLGSLYLKRLISSYDGSYIMAIAAYNAGSGHIHHWVRQFGTPGNDIDNAVNWIEKIPFTETRNYVQRVLENIQVYRYIEAGSGSAKLRLGEDLVR